MTHERTSAARIPLMLPVMLGRTSSLYYWGFGPILFLSGPLSTPKIKLFVESKGY